MHFTFYAIPSFIGFLFNFFFGFYVLRKNPKSAVNRGYFYVCMSFAAWGFGDAFQTFASSEPVSRFFSDILMCGGITMMSVFFLHFGLVFAEKKKLLAKKLTYIWLYGPAVIFILLIRFTDFVNLRQMTRTYFGYATTPAPGEAVFLVWIAAYCITTAVLCFKVYRRTKEPRKKKAAFLFFLGFLLTFVFGFTGDGILSMFKIFFFSEITIFASIFFDIIIAYAILKYGFMSITPQLAAPTIVKNMPDFLVVLDKELNIAFVNKNAADVLGYQEKEMQNQPFSSIIEGEKEIQELKQVLVQETPISNYDIGYLTKTKEKIPVSLNSFPLLLKNQERLGTVTISRDMRQTRKFIQQIEESKEDVEEKNRELEKAKTDLEVKNSELKEKYQEIERFNKLMVGRELKMTELKKELEELQVKAKAAGKI